MMRGHVIPDDYERAEPTPDDLCMVGRVVLEAADLEYSLATLLAHLRTDGDEPSLVEEFSNAVGADLLAGLRKASRGGPHEKEVEGLCLAARELFHVRHTFAHGVLIVLRPSRQRAMLRIVRPRDRVMVEDQSGLVVRIDEATVSEIVFRIRDIGGMAADVLASMGRL